MRMQTISFVLGSALLLTACAGGQKRQPSPQLSADCSRLASDAAAPLYAAGNIKKVTPLYRTEFIARAIQPTFVAGAEIQIPAHDVHDAYLERALRCRAASPGVGLSDVAADPLRVQGVENVRVRSKGQMTHIAITSTDKAAAKQILQHARTLQESGGTVEVQQLSANTGNATF